MNQHKGLSGKYAEEKAVVDPTLRTLTSLSTGVFLTWANPFDKIEILEVGVIMSADSGAVSTGGEITLEVKNPGDAAFAAPFAGAKVTVEANGDSPNAFATDLDQATEGEYSGLLGAPDYPTLLKGGLVALDLTVQGSGGTQTGYPYFKYRQRPLTGADE